jgi:hypothetical protein
VDQVSRTGDRQLTPPQASPVLNGLAEHIAAVESARMRLGRDLDRLTVEVRAQMSKRMQQTAWKALGTGGTILAGLAARKLLTAAWMKARKTQPPSNPAAPGTSWGEALAWAAASGLAVAIVRLLAQRGAAAGWQKAMGSLPPGLQDAT